MRHEHWVVNEKRLVAMTLDEVNEEVVDHRRPEFALVNFPLSACDQIRIPVAFITRWRITRFVTRPHAMLIETML